MRTFVVDGLSIFIAFLISLIVAESTTGNDTAIDLFIGVSLGWCAGLLSLWVNGRLDVAKEQRDGR